MSTPPHSRSASAPGDRARVDCHESQQLTDGWLAACCAPDLHETPATIDALSWHAARVPGTAAGALRDAGESWGGDQTDLDSQDWWFRTSFDAAPAAAGEQLLLCLDGIATVAEVYLNGERVLASDSMFAAHVLDVDGLLQAHNELAIRCRALGPLLEVRRRPRARWRTRLVAQANLRFFRTMLLGRCPGIAPGPAAVGPWRPVRLERRRRIAVDQLALRTRLRGREGVLSVDARIRALEGSSPSSVTVVLEGPSGRHVEQLAMVLGAAEDGPELTARGELTVVDVARWWPHTHGEPALHDVRVILHYDEQATIEIAAGRVGFRELAFGAGPEHAIERDGLDLHVNGVRVFVRGAVWTPADPVSLAPSGEELRAVLTRARDAGMNMLRIPGTSFYETTAFHDLCDELGMLVWQDFMFANFDYPFADEHFCATVERELGEALATVAGRASLAVLCGNSEVEQQAAMLGVEATPARGELFGELLPARIRDGGLDCLYVPSAPCGGDLPFRPGQGIGTYYGLGCYLLPLEDVRRADVRFAAECLAFSHLPEAASVEAVAPAEAEKIDAAAPDTGEQHAGEQHTGDAIWRTGVQRENGAEWDFQDVNDHYLQLLFGVDAAELRGVDAARYLELSRALTGELLAEAFGEWRRAGSRCGGGLILWLRDLLPGAGWGVLDSRGLPKLAYYALERALAPIAVWTVEEQLAGIVAHVANDRPSPLRAVLRVALYRDHEHLVEQARMPLELAAHASGEWNVEALIGHFVDVGWSYRFGPPAQDTVVVSLEDREAAPAMLAQSFRFPSGRPLVQEDPQQLGLEAHARTLADGTVELSVRSRRLAYGVHLHTPGFVPDDDGFSIEPGGVRTITLRPDGPDPAGAVEPGTVATLGAAVEPGTVGALNMSGRLPIAATPSP
jgi:beta-mannosidase